MLTMFQACFFVYQTIHAWKYRRQFGTGNFNIQMFSTPIMMILVLSDHYHSYVNHLGMSQCWASDFLMVLIILGFKEVQSNTHVP